MARLFGLSMKEVDPLCLNIVTRGVSGVDALRGRQLTVDPRVVDVALCLARALILFSITVVCFVVLSASIRGCLAQGVKQDFTKRRPVARVDCPGCVA